MSVDINKLTFFKRQSHLLMDEPQIVVLKHGLSLNAAFSRKITQSGYKRCKLALDVKGDDFTTANNLYIVLTNEEIQDAMVSGTPMRRLGEVADITAAALYLASPAASYVTGQILGVDGGIRSSNFDMGISDI